MIRRYDYAPRPEVESHTTIRELIDAQEKRAEDRQDYRNRKQSQEERMRDIKAAKGKDIKAFHCETCNKEFVSETIKQVETDWSNTTQYIAYYRSKCLCGRWAQRNITDVHQDRYFAKSRVVAMNREKHAADVIQPFETNYELLYSTKRKDA